MNKSELQPKLYLVLEHVLSSQSQFANKYVHETQPHG